MLILLDEYDTPMQEAYVNGYWDRIVLFMRNLFNASFKANPYLGRAVMTGTACPALLDIYNPWSIINYLDKSS